MSILDTVMSQFGGQMGQEVEAQVAGMIASKLGIDPATAQTAITALTAAHTAPTDTVETAAAQTGMSTDVLSQIMHHIGGEGALGSLASVIGQQQQGEGEGGGIAGALTGMLGGLMGGNKAS